VREFNNIHSPLPTPHSLKKLKIKICGLSREQDIDYINEARPDYCGFVFAESKRQVSPVQASHLRRRLAESIIPVGVFVNASIGDIAALYRDGVINLAQLHGNEDEEYIVRLKEATGNTPIPVITVIKSEIFNTLSRRHGDHGENANIKKPCPPCPPCLRENYYLIDSGAGSGKTFDWETLSSLKIDKPWFLAGGINLENIKQAMALNPFAIDISSGAETDGVKDREKIVQLTATIRKGMKT
jgi:phosphoribosylanthranilate isomerase